MLDDLRNVAKDFNRAFKGSQSAAGEGLGFVEDVIAILEDLQTDRVIHADRVANQLRRCERQKELSGGIAQDFTRIENKLVEVTTSSPMTAFRFTANISTQNFRSREKSADSSKSRSDLANSSGWVFKSQLRPS